MQRLFLFLQRDKRFTTITGNVQSSTIQVIRNFTCCVYMGNACIRAYGDSLIKVILAGKVTRVSHKPCKYNILILPGLYIQYSIT
jgi:hypothetical protein